uniref:Uncharacterized protein n=1 Tax=Arundo donax TaxID=35708 RepID=A0A0A9G3P4_ARUDO
MMHLQDRTTGSWTNYVALTPLVSPEAFFQNSIAYFGITISSSPCSALSSA